MEFKRRKKRGHSQKTYKQWFSEDDGYRIIWRAEACGVRITPCYEAAVRTVIPNYGGTDEVFEMWDFVSDRRCYRTLEAAQKDCERHQKQWLEARQASGVRDLTRIFGKLPLGIPVWVKKKLPRKVYDILMRPRANQEKK